MKTWRGKTALGLLALAVMGAPARAEYSSGRAGPAARDGGVDAGEGDDFKRAVDLQRFRKGNAEWDTQELIASGLTALHKENQKILQELAEIKGRMRRLEGKD